MVIMCSSLRNSGMVRARASRPDLLDSMEGRARNEETIENKGAVEGQTRLLPASGVVVGAGCPYAERQSQPYKSG